MLKPRILLWCCGLALLFVGSASLVAAVGLAAGDNLAAGFLQNPSMPLGTKAPADWYLGSYHQGKITLLRDTKTFKSPPASLCIDTNGKPGTGFAYSPLAQTPTQPLQIGCYIKTSGKFSAKSLQLAIQVFDGQWKQIDWIPLAFPKPSTHWQHIGATATLPQNVVHALLGISFTGNGKIWLDDVAVKFVKVPVGQQPTLAVAPNLPMVVKPYNRRIRYIGRFDTSDPQGPKCQWSASAAELRFYGTAINVVMHDSDQNRFQVIVDGKPTALLVPKAGVLLYNLANKLPLGNHTVEIFKRTEAFFGTTQFLGFRLNAGARLLPLPPVTRRMEIIGDSISCGYGVLAPNQYQHFSNVTEDAYDAYGAIAARAFGADYVCIAWSGKTMAFKNTIPAIYGRTLPTEKKSRCDLSAHIPNVIIIALGTNDFAGGVPPEKSWTAAYLAFIARLRKVYPKAQIFCATSPMISDQWAKKTTPQAHLLKYLRAIVAARKARGDQHVHVLIFALQTGKYGFGADWHPSVGEQRLMAREAIEAITPVTRWSTVHGTKNAIESK